MKTEQFLKDLLQSQELLSDELETLQTQKGEVTDFLRAEFGETPVIKYAGSYAKGTMIREKYDLDIVCYFPSDDERSLKEIYEDVLNHLQKKYLIGKKASAVRITDLKATNSPNGYHIDVVPGKFIRGSKDVFLHVSYGEKERIQTNLKVHVDHIVNSGCGDVIKLVKLWNHRNNLTIKTFILEIFVVQALKGSREKDNLKDSFTKTTEAFKNDFGSVQLVDPANTGNIISDLISSSHRALVVRAAEEAFAKIEDSDDLESWKSVFREKDSRGFSSGPTLIKNPPGQWAW